MAKVKQTKLSVFAKTEPEQPEPQAQEKPDDPIKPRGKGLRESEWKRLEEIGGEFGETAHALAMYAIRDFMRRYEAGEIRTQTKKTLPGL